MELKLHYFKKLYYHSYITIKFSVVCRINQSVIFRSLFVCFYWKVGLRKWRFNWDHRLNWILAFEFWIWILDTFCYSNLDPVAWNCLMQYCTIPLSSVVWSVFKRHPTTSNSELPEEQQLFVPVLDKIGKYQIVVRPWTLEPGDYRFEAKVRIQQSIYNRQFSLIWFAFVT